MVDKTTWGFLFNSINHKQCDGIDNGRYYSYIKGVMRKELKNTVENKTVDKQTWFFLPRVSTINKVVEKEMVDFIVKF